MQNSKEECYYTNQPLGWYEYVGNNPFLEKGMKYFIYLGSLLSKKDYGVAFVFSDSDCLSFVRCLPFKFAEWVTVPAKN